MAHWKKFKLDPTLFASEKAKNDYIEKTRCGLCHEKLVEGDEWSLRAVSQIPGTRTQQAVIVHKRCVDSEHRDVCPECGTALTIERQNENNYSFDEIATCKGCGYTESE